MVLGLCSILYACNAAGSMLVVGRQRSFWEMQAVLQKTLGSLFQAWDAAGACCSCTGVWPTGQLLADAGSVAESSEWPLHSLEG